MADEVEIALGKRFLGRRDVKAVQYPDGHYEPERTPWKMADFRAHVAGTRSLGNYMVGQDGLVKFFAYDIDLTKEGYWIPMDERVMEIMPCNPREVWLEQDHPGRGFLTLRLRTTAELLGRRIYHMTDEMVHVAIAYSGSKGLHVYGLLPEPMPAADARCMAFDILKSMHEPDGSPAFKNTKGENFWAPTAENAPNIDIEVYPKQDTTSDLGNLMRMPLGVNRKSGQRGFFVDCRVGYTQMKVLDPLEALGSTLPWD